VGFYRKFVLPHLINLAMDNKDTARCRSELIPQARGHVLEVGIGSGLNLPFYSGQVSKVYGVDPSPELLHMARRRTGALPFPVELMNASAEALPVESNSADTVVMTWSLCSIPEPRKALREIRRVLKADGELLFIEHGLAPEAKIRTWQSRINRPWKAVAGGCNLNREVDGLISSAGLVIRRLETTYLHGPRVFAFTYKGRAGKG
jgi:ubiquinone/menaquinone biosynthesis C-methylase UbiE